MPPSIEIATVDPISVVPVIVMPSDFSASLIVLFSAIESKVGAVASASMMISLVSLETTPFLSVKAAVIVRLLPVISLGSKS